MLSHRYLDQAIDAAERRASRQAHETSSELTQDTSVDQIENTPEVLNLGATALRGGMSGALMTLRGYFTELQVSGSKSRLPLNEIDKFKHTR